MKTRILGTGSCVPAQVITNDDLSEWLDTSDEWIRKRTGIRQRRVVEEESTADLAVVAAERALENAACRADEIDVIIVATSSGDYIFPNTASLVATRINADKAACFDISVACTGFIYGMQIADAYLSSGMYQKILVIGSEVMSRELDWNDRSVCILFGDGAGAVVVGTGDTGILAIDLHSDGSRAMALTNGGRVTAKQEMAGQKLSDRTTKRYVDYIQMEGQEVFRFAVKQVPESIEEVLRKAGCTKDDIQYYLLHQANQRIIEMVARKLDQSMDKFPMNLDRYGNTSAASIPILLDERNSNHQLNRGDRIVLSGFGAGLSWGSIVLGW